MYGAFEILIPVESNADYFERLPVTDARQANIGELLLEITIFKFKEKFEEL